MYRLYFNLFPGIFAKQPSGSLCLISSAGAGNRLYAAQKNP